jgi:DNA-binding NarL/FixJ family response regulator
MARRNKFTNLGTISLWFFTAFSNIFNEESMPAGIRVEAGMVEKKEEKNSSFHISPIYVQIALVVFAFAVLVCISSWFIGGIMNRHMTDSIEAAFSNAETNITADLKEMETQLDYISETVRLMILKEMRRMRLILIAVGLALSALFSALILRLSSMGKELQNVKEDHGLTPREQEIFGLLLSGKELKEIASILKLSYTGVTYHIKNLFAKLGVQSHTDLLVKYRKK